jgi:uncharacterized protein (DUF1697 family)
MTTFAAFLRAINVGGHNVRMDALRSIFLSLGFSSVQTIIASGNVIFESKQKASELERMLEDELKQSLGYEVATFLRTSPEMSSVIANALFTPATLGEGEDLFVAFVRDPITPAVEEKIVALENVVDSFTVHGREIYWLRRRRLGESLFSGAILEKTIRVPATIRNATTVRKVAAKSVERV